MGGVQSAVYAVEVSDEEYACYTTDQTEKLEVQRLIARTEGDVEQALREAADRQAERRKQKQ